MAAITVYPETVESHMYWNLLKDLNDVVKKELIKRLNHLPFSVEVFVNAISRINK